MNVSLRDVAPLSLRSLQKTPQARLDAFRAAASGPYDVAGRPSSAAPMFRERTREIAPQHAAERARIGARAGFSSRDLEALHSGRPSRAALVGMTQALIDAGQLPSGDGDVAQRIRALQWNFGIGFDAAGYVNEALRAAHRARLSEGEPVRIALADARPGDVITLAASPNAVVIYANHNARGLRVLEVDASFAPGLRVGGYRRETWLCDEATGTWALFDPEASETHDISRIGPGGAPLEGVFRYTR